MNSVKEQRYDKPFELIITDDCSTDNTIQICRDWLEENRGRFASVKLIEAAKNTGVAGNCNRGWRASNGQWIKLMAGDDALLPDCLVLLEQYIQVHPGSQVITSQFKVYRNRLDEDSFVYVDGAQHGQFVNYPVEQQLKMIAAYNGNFPGAQAIRSNVLQKMGGFDERYMFEDLSFAVRFLEGGGKYDYCPEPLSCYRRNEDSLVGNNRRLFHYCYAKDCYRMNRDYCFRYATPKIRLRYRLLWWWTWFSQHLGLNRKKRVPFSLYHTVVNGIFALTNDRAVK